MALNLIACINGEELRLPEELRLQGCSVETIVCGGLAQETPRLLLLSICTVWPFFLALSRSVAIETETLTAGKKDFRWMCEYSVWKFLIVALPLRFKPRSRVWVCVCLPREMFAAPSAVVSIILHNAFNDYDSGVGQCGQWPVPIPAIGSESRFTFLHISKRSLGGEYQLLQ